MSWSAISTHFFNTSKDSDSTTSLGSLFQWLTTLSLKKFFWISNLILPWCNLRPFRRSNAFVTSVSFQVPCQNSQSKLNKRDTLWCRHLFPQTRVIRKWQQISLSSKLDKVLHSESFNISYWFLNHPQDYRIIFLNCV